MTSGLFVSDNARMGKSSITAPKGRATRARNEQVGGNRFFGTTMQWVVLLVVAVIVMALIFYFGRDFRSEVGAPGDGAATAAAIVGATLH